MRKTVVFIGAAAKGSDAVWGGSVATTYNFLKSMANSDKYAIHLIDRAPIRTEDDYRQVMAEAPEGLLHIDDARILQLAFQTGYQPDVIGPIARAPNGVKEYRMANGGTWESIYTPEWFYNAVVIRLNANEEKPVEYHDKYLTISQGVDTEALTPDHNAEQPKWVMWAGDSKRPAKNFDLMKEIESITTLPAPYEFKIMSGYKVEDYWKALDNTALLINTSRYESFCAALYEAKAKGIPTIYREKLHNDRFPDGRIQVPYKAEAYRDAILSLLADPARLKMEGRLSREYCLLKASFHVMRQSYEQAYDLAMKKKSYKLSA